jgi:hypothetical protein
VKLKIFYSLILFSVNWEKATILKFQWQNYMEYSLSMNDTGLPHNKSINGTFIVV